MKPERLVVQAFGPYADREVIEFSRLNGRPLLLIHGPTGGGKSTLLRQCCLACQSCILLWKKIIPRGLWCREKDTHTHSRVGRDRLCCYRKRNTFWL